MAYDALSRTSVIKRIEHSRVQHVGEIVDVGKGDSQDLVKAPSLGAA